MVSRNFLLSLTIFKRRKIGFNHDFFFAKAATNTEWMSDHQILQENLFRHIILPRFLLPYRTPNFPLEELELLQRFAENVEQLADHVPPNTLKMIRSLAKVHLNLRPSAIKEEINGLQPGETFAMFVRFQNCAIIIHMLPNAPSDSNNIIVATFLGKVHPDEVYKNPSDLEVTNISDYGF